MIPLGPGLEHHQSHPHPFFPSCSESLAGDTKAWLSLWVGAGHIPLTAFLSCHPLLSQPSTHWPPPCPKGDTTVQGNGRQALVGPAHSPRLPSGLTLGAGTRGPSGPLGSPRERRGFASPSLSLGGPGTGHWFPDGTSRPPNHAVNPHRPLLPPPPSSSICPQVTQPGPGSSNLLPAPRFSVQGSQGAWQVTSAWHVAGRPSCPGAPSPASHCPVQAVPLRVKPSAGCWGGRHRLPPHPLLISDDHFLFREAGRACRQGPLSGQTPRLAFHTLPLRGRKQGIPQSFQT